VYSYFLIISKREVDVLEVDASFSVSKAAEGTITSNVQTETVASYVGELLDYIARISVETFCTDVVIVATGQNLVLVVEELDAVDDRIDFFAVRGSIPRVLYNGVLEVAEVPKLNTLSK
jgi:hypothetical protein